jgi:copper chaperone
MIQFQVGDMTCGHCVARITQAVKDVDGAARIDVNLDTKRVSIESAHAAGEFSAAISEAGYTPQPVAA